MTCHGKSTLPELLKPIHRWSGQLQHHTGPHPVNLVRMLPSLANFIRGRRVRTARAIVTIRDALSLVERIGKVSPRSAGTISFGLVGQRLGVLVQVVGFLILVQFLQGLSQIGGTAVTLSVVALLLLGGMTLAFMSRRAIINGRLHLEDAIIQRLLFQKTARQTDARWLEVGLSAQGLSRSSGRFVEKLLAGGLGLGLALLVSLALAVLMPKSSVVILSLVLIGVLFAARAAKKIQLSSTNLRVLGAGEKRQRNKYLRGLISKDREGFAMRQAYVEEFRRRLFLLEGIRFYGGIMALIAVSGLVLLSLLAEPPKVGNFIFGPLEILLVSNFFLIQLKAAVESLSSAILHHGDVEKIASVV